MATSKAAHPGQRKQVVILCCLIIFALYNLAAFADVYSDNRPMRSVFGDIFWPATWSMFTEYSTHNNQLVFEAWSVRAWERIPMETWYPHRWESGHRWQRIRVRESQSIQRALLAATCRHAKVDTVRLVRRRWPKVPGQSPLPAVGVKETVINEFSCNQPFPMPPGRIL